MALFKGGIGSFGRSTLLLLFGVGMVAYGTWLIISV